MNIFSSFKLKMVWIPLSVIFLSGSIYFSINSYETHNFCTIGLNDSFPFIGCIQDSFGDSPFYGVHQSGNGCGMFGCPKKPLILLYPEKDTEAKVKLDYKNKFSATFPVYGDQISGWSVIAHPDGTLYDISSDQDTYGLFWEGNPGDIHFDMSEGFVVPGSKIREFLYQKLTDIGLNTKERSDFIMYWYPLLQKYKYIQITFAGTDYTDTAKLEISPHPDSLLRVFMVARPLDTYIQIPEQKIEKFERKGFSVVEWGGTIIQNSSIQ